jgi:hypothetical protein
VTDRAQVKAIQPSMCLLKVVAVSIIAPREQRAMTKKCGASAGHSNPKSEIVSGASHIISSYPLWARQ